MNSSLASAFERDGFVFLANFVSDQSLTEVRSALTTIFAAYAKPGEDTFATITRLAQHEQDTFYRIYKFIARSFIALSRIRLECLEIAKQLLPAGSYIDIGSAVIFALPNDKRLIWDWHQETPYDPKIIDAVHFNYPIFERAHLGNGTMSLLKGSHKCGTLPYRKVKVSDNSATSLVPEGMKDLESRFERVDFIADPGDAVVFHNDMIHTSNMNFSGRPRITGLVRIASVDKVPSVASWIDGKAY